MSSIKYVLKEFINSPKFFILFMINVSIGLTGFIVLESFKISFNENLEKRSKNILGSDLSVEGRFKLDTKKIEEIKKILKSDIFVTKLSLFSMVKTKKIVGLFI